jgi:hypothetical protein
MLILPILVHLGGHLSKLYPLTSSGLNSKRPFAKGYKTELVGYRKIFNTEKRIALPEVANENYRLVQSQFKRLSL